jgi:O-antigen/teichoic acid export membrane protein
MSVRSRIIKVGVAKSAEMGIVSLVRFFSVPLFLHCWSADLYGEWLVLYSFIAYFTLGSLGFGQAAANEMTMAVSRDDREAARVTYQSTLAIVLVLCAALLAVGAAVIFALPLHSWLEMKLTSPEEVRWVLVLFLLYVVIWFLSGPVTGAFRAVGKVHRAIVWTNAGMLAEFGAMALALLLRGGFVWVALAMVLARLATVLVMQIDQLVIVPWMRPGFAHASRAEFRRLVSPAMAFVAFPLGNTVINQGIIIAIQSVLGPVAVVVFNSLRTLTNMVTRLFDLVNQAFSPEVSMAWGAENRDLLQRLHRVSCQASFWMGLLSAAGLFWLGPWIFRVWTHGKVEMDLPLFWGFLILVVIRGLWYTSFVVPMSINRHQRSTLGYMLSSVAGLGVSALLLSYGLAWSLAGFVLVEALMAALVLPQSVALTQDTLARFAAGVLPPPNPFSVVRMALGKSKGAAA